MLAAGSSMSRAVWHLNLLMLTSRPCITEYRQSMLLLSAVAVDDHKLPSVCAAVVEGTATTRA
jgi:hypothetical protein